MAHRPIVLSADQRRNHVFLGGLLVAALLAAAGGVRAAEHQGRTQHAGEAVTIYHAPGEQRRVELMNALTTSIDVPQESPLRRRLSREERDALNQELREALRGAYRNRIGPAD